MEEKARIALNNFKKVFDGQKNKVFTLKNKNYTGEMGNYLEEILGVKRNNKNRPDFEGWEIKTKSRGKSYFAYMPKDICVVTCAPNQKGAAREILNKYGYKDKDGEYCLRTTLGFDLNERGLKIVPNITNSSIEIHDIEGKTKFDWAHEKIKCYFDNKYKNGLIFVEIEKPDSDHFIFKSAKAYYTFDSEKFLNLILEGKIKIGINIGNYKSGSKKGQVHDHGMNFTISEENLPMLFSDMCIV